MMNKSYVYLLSDDKGNSYTGSIEENPDKDYDLSARWNTHMSEIRGKGNKKSNLWDGLSKDIKDWKIDILEEVKAEDRKEREQYWKDLKKSNLNFRNPVAKQRSMNDTIRLEQRVKCGCGSETSKHGLYMHLKTKKHRIWDAKTNYQSKGC